MLSWWWICVPLLPLPQHLDRYFFTMKFWVWLLGQSGLQHPQNPAPRGAVGLQTLLLDDPSPNSASNPPLLAWEELVDPIYNEISYCGSYFGDQITPIAYFSPFPWTKPGAIMERDMPNPSPQNRVSGTDSTGGAANAPNSKMSFSWHSQNVIFLPLFSSLLPAATPGLGPPGAGSWIYPIPCSQPTTLPRRGQDCIHI